MSDDTDNEVISHARYCLLARRRLLPMLSRDGRDRRPRSPYNFAQHPRLSLSLSLTRPEIIFPRQSVNYPGNLTATYTESDWIFGETRQFDGGDNCMHLSRVHKSYKS